MLKLAVVGKDVSRSQSPAMHGFLLHAMGETCRYDRRSLPPEGFSEAFEALLAEYDGLNVTIPYKREIAPMLEFRGEAAVLGAANTVLCAERAGYNTDGFGFSLMLKGAGVEVAGKRALVLGAGGAGVSCLLELKRAGAEVSLFSRTYARVQELAARFGAVPREKLPAGPFDLIVNCTGVGMNATEGSSPVPAELIARCTAAVDLIYEPAETEFLRLAREAGRQTVNGEAMLFYQAYAADCLFLGRETDTAEAESLFQRYKKEGSR